MDISALSAAAANTGSSNDISQQTNDMFLQLLTAQLQNQSPIDPVDPTQFVGQLVQFNMLDQMIQIRELLQQATTAPAQ